VKATGVLPYTGICSVVDANMIRTLVERVGDARPSLVIVRALDSFYT
jgi:hypothetical protein